VVALEALHRAAGDRAEDAIRRHRELALDRRDRRADVAEAKELRLPSGRRGERRGVERGVGAAACVAPTAAAGERGHDGRGQHGGAHRERRPLAPLAVAAAGLRQPAALARAGARLVPQLLGGEVAAALWVRVQIRRPVVHDVVSFFRCAPAR
jgi:hypothetical protein